MREAEESEGERRCDDGSRGKKKKERKRRKPRVR